MAVRKIKLSDGSVRYEATYRDPRARERSKRFATKRDAERFLARQSADMQRGDYSDPQLGRISLEQWAEEWIATTVHLKPKTRVGYRSILDTHVLPAFGDLRVASIEQVDVRRFLAALAASGAAPGTVRNVYRVLSQVLGAAVGSGALKANPAAGIRLPRSPHAEMLFLSAEQVLRLADAIGGRYGTLITFAAYTGLRAGEIGALRCGRVDLVDGAVDVVESLSEVNGKLAFGPTKTYARRTVRLPRFLVEELTVYLGHAANDADAFVFTAPAGGPLRHNLFYQRAFRPAVRRAGLADGLRFHDLRHTCAALLIAQGAHPKAMQERLGHSSITVTLDRYGHLFPSLDEALTEGLDGTYRAALAEFSRSSAKSTISDLLQPAGA